MEHHSKPSIVDTPRFVATVFSLNREDANKGFEDFLRNSHKLEITWTRILKYASPEDPLWVFDHFFPEEEVDLDALRESARHWAAGYVKVDVAIQCDDVWRKHKRLVVFDMDSTLIKQEVIDEIALEVDKTMPHKEVGRKVAVPPFQILLTSGNHRVRYVGPD